MEERTREQIPHTSTSTTIKVERREFFYNKNRYSTLCCTITTLWIYINIYIIISDTHSHIRVCALEQMLCEYAAAFSGGPTNIEWAAYLFLIHCERLSSTATSYATMSNTYACQISWSPTNVIRRREKKTRISDIIETERKIDILDKMLWNCLYWIFWMAFLCERSHIADSGNVHSCVYNVLCMNSIAQWYTRHLPIIDCYDRAVVHWLIDWWWWLY